MFICYVCCSLWCVLYRFFGGCQTLFAKNFTFFYKYLIFIKLKSIKFACYANALMMSSSKLSGLVVGA